MITIKNTQRTVKLDTETIRADIQRILDILDYSDFDIGLWLTTDKTIRFYNATYRHKDKATDILSFPYHTELKAGKRIKITMPEDKNLGDLIISVAYVQRAAQELKTSLEARLQVLLVHGICHLLAYDHITDSDYRRMRAKEAYILKKLKN